MLSHQEIQAQDQLWTVKQVAHFLNKGRTWVYSNVHKIPHCRVGAELRFDPETIKRWVNGEVAPVLSIANVRK